MRKINLTEELIKEIDNIVHNHTKSRRKDVSRSVLELFEKKNITRNLCSIENSKKEILIHNTSSIKFYIDPIYEISDINFSGVIKCEKDKNVVMEKINKLPLRDGIQSLTVMKVFKKIFIENEIKNTNQVERILSKIPKEIVKQTTYIDKYDEIFGRVKKPYLQKRDNLNLFWPKKGQIVKEAPDAYGIGKEKHFYFINSYNCIYECEYCYLQGFFNSPDIVLFVNWDDIKEAIVNSAKNNPNCWFHAGELVILLHCPI